MRKLTSLVVAMSLALGAANIVHAAADNLTPPPAGAEKPAHKPGMHGHKHGPMAMLKDLNLTDAQKTQIRDIMKAGRKEMKRPSVEEMRQNHAIIAASSFDQAKAALQADKMTANAKENAVAMMATQNKIYNVLTAEQKKQYDANFEKHLAEMGKHKDKMLTPAE
ncbi:ATP-independent periplasmic protein-refolding chaperone Spy [Pantoea sp. 1.19]|uniref:ATP-independent periplasmic protein-refolding chaperone Spy n=1 Tax=Pantoea sp. 1.19 TaxID=1925589 RepID=UPI000948E3A3|nr:ATP-independent periplasmic protein-refolding chaperone Spy [Pantoea sp. 1.19]